MLTIYNAAVSSPRIACVLLSVVNTLDSSDLPVLLPNTLGLSSQARRAQRLSSLQQLPALVDWVQEQTEDAFVLGGGSNVILPPDVGRPVVLVQNKGVRLLRETATARIVEAQAGEVWHDFVSVTLSQGWAGLENLALIPGTVGAAPVQNIGAYGVELQQRVDSVLVWDFREARQVELSAADCGFRYRDSIFKQAGNGRWLILAVRFALPLDWTPVLDYPDLRKHPRLADVSAVMPRAVFQAVCEIRRAKLPDPAVLGNAGSFFKNPLVEEAQLQALKSRYPAMPSYDQGGGWHKVAAGWLIEHAGWKGKRLGPVGMHERQALVLVNHGGAAAEDVLALEAAVRADVQAKFGIALEREPVRVE